ncbi:MAG: hypothetical protein IIZ67_04795 [Bacilli bacterium]|nr:hypothetical protein [Bacilli bacterium]
MKPHTYDMTFCTSRCNHKCDRHYSLYEFENNRLYSMADFNCDNKKERKTKEIRVRRV